MGGEKNGRELSDNWTRIILAPVPPRRPRLALQPLALPVPPPPPPSHSPEGVASAHLAATPPRPGPSPSPSHQNALLRLILHCSAQVHEGGGTSWLAYRGDMTVACGESKPSQTRERAASGTK